MTGSSQEASPPPEHSPGRSVQDRGSTVSMTSTTTGLPDRYRPIDQVGPDEPTPTGVIQCWRAKDRVLNRDVAIRVHTPAGPAAHAWISRALTAGGLATPALAMVYDASEGSGDPQAPGGAAYVVNEWIDGETLAERLTRGPMPDREVRTVLRRLAEGVAEAHRVGLAVGGLTPENVVLRPNGLVGLRAVPAATGSIDGDIAALGALLEACLTGLTSDGSPRPLTGPSDLVALVRRARSTEPGQGLSSVAAMASLLAERPRYRAGSGVGPAPHRAPPGRHRQRLAPPPAGASSGRRPCGRSGRRGAGRAAGSADDAARPGGPPGHEVRRRPPVGRARRRHDRRQQRRSPRRRLRRPPDRAGARARCLRRALLGRPRGVLRRAGRRRLRRARHRRDRHRRGRRAPASARRHRPAAAGSPRRRRARLVGRLDPARRDRLGRPGAGIHAVGQRAGQRIDGGRSGGSAAAGAAIPIVTASVFDPLGDGQPENDNRTCRWPTTATRRPPGPPWSTAARRTSATSRTASACCSTSASRSPSPGVTVDTTAPGATVEIRTADKRRGQARRFHAGRRRHAGQATTDLTFDKPVTARFVLVWVTGLVPSENGFSADIAEVAVHAAG